MSDVSIQYFFPKGEYRVKVRTKYKDEKNQNQYIDSDPVPFTSEAKEYSLFVTNPNIKIDLDTMEAPNAELVDEGQYFGLDYKTYDNGLAIVTGTQSGSMTASDRNAAPWNGDDIQYCYADGAYCSGFVFGSNNILESHILGGFGSLSTTPSYFLIGDNYLYIDISDLFPPTACSNFSDVLRFKTVDLNGFHNWIECVWGPVDHGMPMTITDLTDLMAFSVSRDFLDMSNGFTIKLLSQVTNADGVISGDFPNTKITLTMDRAFNHVLNANYCGKIGTLYIHSEEYILDQFSYMNAINVFVDCPISNSITTFPSMTCPNLEKLIFNYSMNFDNITRYNNAFKRCNKIKVIGRVRSQYYSDPFTEYGRVFDVSNATSLSSMFEGCSDLVDSGIQGTDPDDVSEIHLINRCNLSSMFKGCNRLTYNLQIICDKAWTYLNNAFENSGIRSLSIEIPLTTSAYNIGTMEYMCRNSSIIFFSMYIKCKTSSSVSMDEAFKGCVDLESFYAFNEYARTSSGIANGFKMSHANSIFDGCTKLTAVDFGTVSFDNDETSEGLNTFFDDENILSNVRIGYLREAIPFHKSMQREDGVIVTSATAVTDRTYTYQSIA